MKKMGITSVYDLTDAAQELVAWLRERGFKISLCEYGENEFGEMEIISPDNDSEYFHGDDEIRTFFRALAFYLRST